MSRAIQHDEARWQREDDARTLARAEEILGDKKRHKGAVKEAGIIASKRDKEIAAMKKVAAKKKKKVAPKKKAVVKKKKAVVKKKKAVVKKKK